MDGYRVEVKHRSQPPSPWKWEIYHGEQPMWVEQSRDTFRSRDAAFQAGTEAIKRLRSITRKKRPRDANQLAKSIVDIATGETEDRAPTPDEMGKDPAAVSLGQRGGLKGGKARAKALTAQQRSEIAKNAAKSRWKK